MININTNFQGVRVNNGSVMVGVLLLVLVASVIAATTISSVTSVQRVVANSLREMNAFEAAESGIEYGVMYGKLNLASIIVDSDHDGHISYVVPPPAGSHYTVTYSNPIINNFNLFDITSVGTSSDNATSQTITQQVYRYSYLAIAPPAVLSALGSVALSGSVDVTNHDQTAIWSGGSVSMGNAVGVDGSIKANDAQLVTLTHDQYFNNFFNKTKDSAKNEADLVYTNTVDTNYSGDYLTDVNGLNGVTDKTIYISQAAGTTATINSNAVIGSATHPVIIIVDGDFKFNGNATIYGTIYVIGNWINGGSGSAVLKGAAIVEGNMSSAGAADLFFDPIGTNMTNRSTLVKVPGTWRDF